MKPYIIGAAGLPKSITQHMLSAVLLHAVKPDIPIEANGHFSPTGRALWVKWRTSSPDSAA